jgi:uncharacterized membrane protein
MWPKNDQNAVQTLRPAITAPVFPSTSTEFINVMAHYHRAEIARMAGWRDRIDRTTNWAITVVAAMLSVSLSTPTAHHGVLLFAMVLVLLLLVIEARRYRFFDVYRNRVRRMERNYYAQIFSPEDGTTDDWIHKLGDDLRRPLFLTSHSQAISRRMRRNYYAQIFSPEDGTTDDWIHKLGDDLRRPLFLTSHSQAISRRMRRNYCWLFLILLVAWLVKTTFIRMQESAVETHLVGSAGEWVRNAAIGPVPGWIVILAVTLFYGWVLLASLRRPKGEGELAFGNVHV